VLLAREPKPPELSASCLGNHAPLAVHLEAAEIEDIERLAGRVKTHVDRP
jgi:hypothetical protein